MNRRILLKRSLATAATLLTTPAWSLARSTETNRRGEPKYQMDLCGGRVGIDANQDGLIELASKNGFNAVEPLVWELKSKTPEQVAALKSKLAEKKLVWSAANLPVEFRQSDKKFKEDLAALPDFAKGLQNAGVTRIGTWIMPCHESLTYRANFRLHSTRLNEAAKILKDHGLRLGLEYVGTKSLWTQKRYPFMHTMKETSELIAVIGLDNVGFILDSWHWTMAGESVDDIKSLKNEQIVACDLNDAPAGIEQDQQNDTTRELPMATGVIDVKAFLNALVASGYDGPIRAEPFSKSLNEMDNEAAAAATGEAMKKAFASVGGD